MWLFHIVCVSIYAYTFYFDYKLTVNNKLDLPIPKEYASKFVWLTMVNLLLQFIYHSVGAICGLLYNKSNRQNAKKLEYFHFVATTFAFPIAVTVSVLFWGLYYADPNMLINEQAKKVLSITWFNHAIHSLPGLTMIFDFYGWRHSRPIKTQSIICIFVFVLSYLTLVYYIAYFHKFWAYPVLENLSVLQQIIFIFFCTLIVFGAFILGDSFNIWLHYPGHTTHIQIPTKSKTKKGKKKHY